MPSERINGIKINLGTATQDELINIQRHIRARIEQEQMELQIVRDYLLQRFGDVALAGAGLTVEDDQLPEFYD